VEEELISRGEVAALLFGVGDIVKSLRNIELLLGGGEDGEEEEADEG
jgi:hypothetical protein